jgi:hypothetical protein
MVSTVNCYNVIFITLRNLVYNRLSQEDDELDLTAWSVRLARLLRYLSFTYL